MLHFLTCIAIIVIGANVARKWLAERRAFKNLTPEERACAKYWGVKLTS